jgi:tetratricopeptide (TPR) repeat protein
MIHLAALVLALALPEPELPACVEQLSSDATACDASLAAARDPKLKSRLLLRRAYALNEKARYEAALADLDAAVAADPAYGMAWHERAYTHSELREFDKAAADADRDVAVRPDSADAYRERAFARHGLGDFKGDFDDRSKVVALSPGNPSALLARGRAALWIGRADDARADTAKALALAEKAGEAAVADASRSQQALIARWTARSPAASPAAACRAAAKANRLDAPNLIGDCTAAFLAAATPHDRAELLALRALAWLVAAQDQVSSVDDTAMTVALEPGNAQWHANLGGMYLMVHHSWAARRELDIAIRLHDGWMARGQRAAARYNLQDYDGAFADAKRSVEMEPNEVALTVLGQLAHDRGDDKSAKLFWMSAWHLGSHDADLLAKLKEIGVADPEKEPKP